MNTVFLLTHACLLMYTVLADNYSVCRYMYLYSGVADYRICRYVYNVLADTYRVCRYEYSVLADPCMSIDVHCSS